MNLRHRSIAVEIISQQSNQFADILVAHFEELYKFKSARDAQESASCKAIVDVLAKYVGMKVDLQFNTDNPPCCMPLLANTKHVLSTFLINDVYSEQTDTFEEAIRKSAIKRGTIDLVKGKLGGVYSEITSPIWMSFYFCKNNFTPREAAAVLMHEVGIVLQHTSSCTVPCAQANSWPICIKSAHVVTHLSRMSTLWNSLLLI